MQASYRCFSHLQEEQDSCAECSHQIRSIRTPLLKWSIKGREKTEIILANSPSEEGNSRHDKQSFTINNIQHFRKIFYKKEKN